MQVKSINGSRYYILLKDDYSHYRTVYFLKSKGETVDRLKDFIVMTKNQLGRGVRILRTDNGLEFVNAAVKELLGSHGIQHQGTVAYTPEQNGSAERENRTIVEAARSMIQAKGLPLKLWAEAVNTAVYNLNRTGPSRERLKTPFELWFGQAAEVGKLASFGTTAYPHVPNQKRQKLDKKATKGYFVGYDQEVKGFRIWFPDLDSRAEKRRNFRGKRGLHRGLH